MKRDSPKKWGHICSKCVAHAIRDNGGSYTARDGTTKKLGDGNAFVATAREQALAKSVLAAIKAPSPHRGNGNSANGSGTANHQGQVAAFHANTDIFHDAETYEDPGAADENVLHAFVANTGTSSGCMAGLLSENTSIGQ